MVDVDKAVIARYSHSGHHFEVLVDPNGAKDVKEGKEVPLEDLVASEQVYKDAKKGDKCSEEILEKVFETLDLLEIVKRIIKKGEVHLTSDQRKEMMLTKKRAIAALISRNAINPQTNAPHPQERIERAMDEARVHLDLFKPVEEQLDHVVKLLRPLIPLKFEKRKIAIKIGSEYAAKAYPHIKSFGTMSQEAWQTDGSWICVVEIPGGMQNQLFEMLGSLTKGTAETRILDH